jgi:heptosyltransferase-2
MDRLAYVLYRAVAALLGRLPVSVVFAIGEALGFIGYLVAWPYRRLALRNLEIAFGREKSAAERRAIARRHFVSLGGNMLASVRIAGMPREEIRELFEVEGTEITDRLAREKRGFMFVLSHMGNWELMAQIGPIVWSCPLGTVYQRLGNPYIDAEVRAARARQGLQLFERKEGFQGAIRVLRAGGGAGVLVDQHAGDAGVWVPFFGRLASTSSLAAMLALRTGAALLPMAVYTVGRGRWKMVLAPPVETEGARSAEALTAEINRAVEAQIRVQPADWFWVHNRWKLPSPKFLLATYKRGIAGAAAPGEAGAAASALQPFPVVIRASNWLGDAVMSMPAVRAIKRGRPDLHLAVLTPAKLAELWKAVEEVDEVIAIAPGESVFAVAAKLRGRFEAAILFPNSLRTALEVWLAGIPRRVGYPGHRRAWLLNQVWREKKTKRKVAAPTEHQVHHYLRLAEFIGADPEKLPEPAPRVRAAGAALRIGVCPGAEYGPAKRWLPERFREVMEKFPIAGGEWVIFGVEKDAPVAAEIVSGFTGAVRNLVGQTSLGGLLEELRECDALLTNDTGTMHLAALLGIPVVAVFGSTEPALTGPLGDHHRVLRHHVECSPCFLRECPIDFRCMKAIEPAEVAAAVEGMLASGSAAPPGPG